MTAERGLRADWTRAYEACTLREADHVARLIGGCYASFPYFASFTAFSMFYFAAASFSEMARRLGRPSRGFLCADDVAFAHHLVRDVGFAVVPGSSFYHGSALGSQRVRFCFAKKMETLQRVERLLPKIVRR